jgi:hypothetical protein
MILETELFRLITFEINVANYLINTLLSLQIPFSRLLGVNNIILFSEIISVLSPSEHILLLNVKNMVSYVFHFSVSIECLISSAAL